jgi:hypothetical protein
MRPPRRVFYFSGKSLKQIAEIAGGPPLVIHDDHGRKEDAMFTISLVFVSTALFGAHVWDLYQDLRQAMPLISTEPSE